MLRLANRVARTEIRYPELAGLERSQVRCELYRVVCASRPDTEFHSNPRPAGQTDRSLHSRRSGRSRQDLLY
ncbi:hypothetical protein RRG08_046218 [Elysia crispata]|uniref:Uncharacterized protein n=1 Tax=Elysia crispata TaxID=231223 RepID=A0AAE0YNA8_9GAST|nr:hypothetical protein RRG08_046218 [Elysia crispata]